MGLRTQVKLDDVMVVHDRELFSPEQLEANAPDEPGEAPAEGGTFVLYVDRAGLTLHLMAVPAIERRWLWSSVEGFRTGTAGEPQEGRLRTPVDLTVDGRRVRLLVPSDQLPARRLAALEKLAALQHMAEVAAHDDECPGLEPEAEAGPADPVPARQPVNHPWHYPRPRRSTRPGRVAAALVTVAAAVAALTFMAQANDGSIPGMPHVPRVAASGGTGSPPVAPVPPSASPSTSGSRAGPIASSGGGTAGGAHAPLTSNAPTASAPAPAPPSSPPPSLSAPPAATPPPASPSSPPPTPSVPPPGGLGGLAPSPPAVTVPGIPVLGGRGGSSGSSAPGGSPSSATAPSPTGPSLRALPAGLP